MATRPFIGLKRVWYGDVVKTVTTPETGYTVAELKALIATMTEVKNVHQDTWGYEESDPSVTDYINELTGQPITVTLRRRLFLPCRSPLVSILSRTRQLYKAVRQRMMAGNVQT